MAVVSAARPTGSDGEELTVRLNIDPGATISLLRTDVCEALGLKVSSFPSDMVRLVDAFGVKSSAKGKVKVKVRIGSVVFWSTFVVVRDLVAPVLLGTDLYDIAWMKLRFPAENLLSDEDCLMIGYDDTDTSRNAQAQVIGSVSTAGEPIEKVSEEENRILEALLEKYSSIFWTEGQELGCANNFVADATLVGDPVPVTSAHYPVSHSEMKRIEDHLQEMLRLKIIKKAEHTHWAAPLLLIRKRAGGDRVVVDFRKLNAVISSYGYPLPRIDDILDSLNGAELFSIMDLVQGFHQVLISERATELFSFVTPKGKYSYLRLPQGAKISPNIFQQVMDITLDGLRFRCAVAYIDDVMVWSKPGEDHLEKLEAVFRRFQETNLKLKLSKCHFLKTEVDFLGYHLSSKGISPMKQRIEAIETIPAPNKLRELRAFIGLCNYYRRLIHQFSSIAAPLYELTKKGVEWEWTEERDQAFRSLKEKLMSEPIVVPPDYEQPFILITDAANKLGLGAVLSQIQRGEEVVITYISRSLKDAERNYDTHEAECLAVIWAIKKLRCYLAGEKEFKVLTDHKALTGLMKTSNPTGKKARWIAFLQEFSFSVEHRSGVDNANADALSRNPRFQASAIQRESRLVPSRLAVEQQEDTHLGPIFTFLKHKRLPEERMLAERVSKLCQEYEVRTDGKSQVETLFRRVDVRKVSRVYSKKKGAKTTSLFRIAIPKSRIKWVMQKFHDDPGEGSHLGIAKTYKKLQARFHWDGMYKDTVKHVKSCDVCQRFPGHKAIRQTEMHTVAAQRPMQVVQVDDIGTFTTSSRASSTVVWAVYDR